MTKYIKAKNKILASKIIYVGLLIFMISMRILQNPNSIRIIRPMIYHGYALAVKSITDRSSAKELLFPDKYKRFTLSWQDSKTFLRTKAQDIHNLTWSKSRVRPEDHTHIPNFGMTLHTVIDQTHPLFSKVKRVWEELNEKLKQNKLDAKIKLADPASFFNSLTIVKVASSVPIKEEEKKLRIEKVDRRVKDFPWASIFTINAVNMFPGGVLLLEVYVNEEFDKWNEELYSELGHRPHFDPWNYHVTFGFITKDLSSEEAETLINILEPLRNITIGDFPVHQLELIEYEALAGTKKILRTWNSPAGSQAPDIAYPQHPICNHSSKIESCL